MTALAGCISAILRPAAELQRSIPTLEQPIGGHPHAKDEGRLGGIALDVYEDEKELAVSLRAGTQTARDGVRTTLELASRENVICTPHNAFNTAEAVERKARQSVEQVEHFLRQGRFLWSVPQ